jgi:hypothetical protein
MKLSKRRALLLALCITALCSILVAAPLLTQPKPNLHTATAKAIDFLEDRNEPYALLWLDVIYRRFGVAEFADSLQRYDQLLTEQPENAALLRVFRRIADYDNPLLTEDLQAVILPSDIIIVHALYCDRPERGLPIDYSRMLDREAGDGGYHLTHVLLALIWVQENGCELELPDGFLDAIYHANAALINTDSAVTDLELEAAAFLYLAGQGDLVDDSFIERAILSQNGDGSWGSSSNEEEAEYWHWHSTILGLLLLLHVEFPAGAYPPVLDSASP